MCSSLLLLKVLPILLVMKKKNIRQTEIKLACSFINQLFINYFSAEPSL